MTVLTTFDRFDRFDKNGDGLGSVRHGAHGTCREKGRTRLQRRAAGAYDLAILAPKLGNLGEEKLRKLLKNGRTDALSTLTEHPVSLSAGGGPSISFTRRAIMLPRASAVCPPQP